MSKKTIYWIVGGIIIFATLRGGIDWKNIKNFGIWKGVNVGTQDDS